MPYLMLFSIKITEHSHINLSKTAVYQYIYRSFIIIRIKPPIFCKIVSDTIRNNSKRVIVLIGNIRKHNAVYSIVYGSVTTHDDNRAIAIVCQCTGQSLNRTESIRLHVIEQDSATFHITANLLPALLRFPTSSFWVIYHSPTSRFHCHFLILY